MEGIMEMTLRKSLDAVPGWFAGEIPDLHDYKTIASGPVKTEQNRA